MDVSEVCACWLDIVWLSKEGYLKYGSEVTRVSLDHHMRSCPYDRCPRELRSDMPERQPYDLVCVCQLKHFLPVPHTSSLYTSTPDLQPTLHCVWCVGGCMCPYCFCILWTYLLKIRAHRHGWIQKPPFLRACLDTIQYSDWYRQRGLSDIARGFYICNYYYKTKYVVYVVISSKVI